MARRSHSVMGRGFAMIDTILQKGLGFKTLIDIACPKFTLKYKSEGSRIPSKLKMRLILSNYNRFNLS